MRLFTPAFVDITLDTAWARASDNLIFPAGSPLVSAYPATINTSVGSLISSWMSCDLNRVTSWSTAGRGRSALPVAKLMTVSRFMDLAVSTLSVSFDFSEALIPGIALIRVNTSCLVAAISAALNCVGLVLTVCPELLPPLGLPDGWGLAFPLGEP
jgi:hypothetical protein